MRRIFQLLSLIVAGTLLAINSYADERQWKFVTTGASSTYAIDKEGSLWSWGWNSSGELGINIKEKEKVSTPTQIEPGSTWVYAAAGQARAYFIKSDGTLWATGDNSKGAQGVGDGQSHQKPTQIGTDNDWKVVATSHFFGYFAFAIKTNGTLWAWGEGETGALGTGAYKNVSKPVKIGNDTDWAQISCGASHVMAIKNDGSLWMWGWNQHNSLADMATHVKVPTRYGMETNWEKVFAIENSSYAVKKDGTLWTWGQNENNSLGLNLNLDQEGNTVKTPRQITAIEGRVLFISGCAEAKIVGVGEADKASKIFAWGKNIDGALGDGKGVANSSSDIPVEYTPVEVLFPKQGLNFTMIGSGQAYTMALADNGELYAWGRNRGGELGNCVEEEFMTFESKPILVGVKNDDIEEQLTFDANNIPSTLPKAKKIILTGTWGTADFSKLSTTLGNNVGIPPVGNNTLEEVDMSAITLKENTSLYVSVGISNAGVFKGCKALKVIKMPSREECAKFSNLKDAFWLCTSLETIDLAGCSNVTSLENTFSNATALKQVNNLKDCVSVTNTNDAFYMCTALEKIELPAIPLLGESMFGDCTALKTIDWTEYKGTTAPKFNPKTFRGLIDDPKVMKGISLVVPDAAFDSFTADEKWNQLTIVKASDYLGIDSLDRSQIAIKKTGSQYRITGLNAGIPYYLYNLSGSLLQKGATPTSGDLVFDVQETVLILQVGTHSIKLL
ncbi:leucine-rich repeat protein [Porphyromonas crevioricanis]|uniref:leucine-rich repeat protein n=1 Tax=Porphyromonas crevioricanis TaxID=393921 RepID=UPI00068E8209|nr:leucine-rich repeat protein [Porphyromonas crevioricanis]